MFTARAGLPGQQTAEGTRNRTQPGVQNPPRRISGTRFMSSLSPPLSPMTPGLTGDVHCLGCCIRPPQGLCACPPYPPATPRVPPPGNSRVK